MLNKWGILCCDSSYVEYSSYVCALETGFLALYDGSFYCLFQLTILPHTCKHIDSPKNDIKTSFGYFHITTTLPRSLNRILKFLREARGKFVHGNISRNSTGKEGGNIHIKNSLSFPLNFRMEIIRKFPRE